MDGPQVEIPEYLCHKLVRAAKITDIVSHRGSSLSDLMLGEIGGRVTVSAGWLVKHQPTVGGYYVRYGDGYESFSPAPAFEQGYTKV